MCDIPETNECPPAGWHSHDSGGFSVQEDVVPGRFAQGGGYSGGAVRADESAGSERCNYMISMKTEFESRVSAVVQHGKGAFETTALQHHRQP